MAHFSIRMCVWVITMFKMERFYYSRRYLIKSTTIKKWYVFFTIYINFLLFKEVETNLIVEWESMENKLKEKDSKIKNLEKQISDLKASQKANQKKIHDLGCNNRDLTKAQKESSKKLRESLSKNDEMAKEICELNKKMIKVHQESEKKIHETVSKLDEMKIKLEELEDKDICSICMVNKVRFKLTFLFFMIRNWLYRTCV